MICINSDNIIDYDEIKERYFIKYGNISAKHIIDLYFAEIMVPFLNIYGDDIEKYNFSFTFVWTSMIINNRNDLQNCIKLIKANQ